MDDKQKKKGGCCRGRGHGHGAKQGNCCGQQNRKRDGSCKQNNKKQASSSSDANDQKDDAE